MLLGESIFTAPHYASPSLCKHTAIQLQTVQF